MAYRLAFKIIREDANDPWLDLKAPNDTAFHPSAPEVSKMLNSSRLHQLLFEISTQERGDPNFELSPPKPPLVQHPEVMTLEGNLYGHSSELTLLAIEGYGPIEPDATTIILDAPEQVGTLTLFLKSSHTHQRGDFIYQLNEPIKQTLSETLDSFEYQLIDAQGAIGRFHLNLSSIHHHLTIGDPSPGFVDEHALLPGSVESTQTHGLLNIESSTLDDLWVRFRPIHAQTGLTQSALTSEGLPLIYSLEEDAQSIVAKQGPVGPEVFKAEIIHNDRYQFTLFKPLDQTPEENLIPSMAKDHQDPHSSQRLWEIPTFANQAHLLSFTQNPSDAFIERDPIQIYWNEHLLTELAPTDTPKNVTISLESALATTSTLKIVGREPQALESEISDLQLINSSMQKMPIEFHFIAQDSVSSPIQGSFSINVAREVPITLTQAQPSTIIYEQSVYETIVVNESTEDHPFPLTTIQLNRLFETLDIDEPNREVEVLQKTQDGQATNVYSINIKDSSSLHAPITVADVQLSFAGGEGGLEVFDKNIHIEES